MCLRHLGILGAKKYLKTRPPSLVNTKSAKPKLIFFPNRIAGLPSEQIFQWAMRHYTYLVPTLSILTSSYQKYKMSKFQTSSQSCHPDVLSSWAILTQRPKVGELKN